MAAVLVPDPDGSKTEFQRAYTISEADVAAGRFAVDIVLHEPAGPASQWARTVQPGATIAVMALMGSSRFDMPGEQPAGYLLIGDSASIPGMNGIIGVVPDEVPIEMYLEQHDDNDTLIPIAQHPRLRLHWVARRDEKSLAAAIESRDWSDWYAWATPEATTLKQVRTRLRDEFGFPKSEVHAQAYWSAGRAMGTCRGDEPEGLKAWRPPSPRKRLRRNWSRLGRFPRRRPPRCRAETGAPRPRADCSRRCARR